MDSLLERSVQFENVLDQILDSAGLDLYDDSPRLLACAQACLLSAEHATIVRLSFSAGAPASGTAVLRLQYEALLRGAWLLHAASDSQVGKLTGVLTLEAEQAAKNLPGALAMLESVKSKAPAGLGLPLVEFHEVSWKALNSFVHGGIHPLRRIADGFPVQLGEQIVRNSNGLLHMGYRLLASLTGSPELMERVTKSYREYVDCLPVLPTPAPQR